MDEEIPRRIRLEDRMMMILSELGIAACVADPRGRFDVGHRHGHDGEGRYETQGVSL